MNTIKAFNEYWKEWKSEQTREDFWEQEFNRVMTESESQKDPLFSSGLLTPEGLQCYRSVVPLEHDNQSLLKGENDATKTVPVNAESDSQLADQQPANAG